jgi:trehalose 2-sulfotransferase
VFATKLMWRHLPELQALAGELPEYADLELVELLTRLFGDPTYVLVSRRDKIRQAVSMWRALQTRSWRLEHGPNDKSPAELHYRFEGIDHLVRSLDADDRGWRDLFAARDISALEISYEDDLERDRDRTVLAVLERIGVEAPSGWQAAEPTKRQADALSDEWVASYHRDCAQRSPGERPAATAAR